MTAAHYTATLRLSPVEAGLGLDVRFRVPVTVTCPACDTGFFPDRFFCASCRSSGYIRTETVATFHVPAGVGHGRIFQIFLPHSDYQNSILELTVFIDQNR